MNRKIKHLMLDNAHDNNIIISDMNLPNKFKEFESSRLNESETLLYEINKKPKIFKKYFRGQIIRVNFGVNIGSEFSGEHYAIVISKDDTIMNPVVHVVPLTSKFHKDNIKIGNILYNEELVLNLKELLKTEKTKRNLRQINYCINYYSNKANKDSYACVNQLKTISKLSICKLKNDYDYLNKLRVSESDLKKIDEEIKKEYTKL